LSSNDSKDEFLFGATLSERKSFQDLGISETLIYALRASQIDHPSVIQSAAFQPIFEGKDVVLGAETGEAFVPLLTLAS
jgi:superfamily II DNA/RNA helicase